MIELEESCCLGRLFFIITAYLGLKEDGGEHKET